ncbi:MAG: 2-hydroxychromene-2-carboxylate isomerase [Proteobacteria bacterium]|jgi:2-hydroxychromene-2-carboxylate isomerase|nr:2-hydroxychromene-2-carboxylate isomerase [Pseudomonadota bacterium]MBT5065873.1 2-hydroxychromene-2-carboxylate isomerase [Pseudomonadota bacterium]MBT6192672.1 2-hydroxychromene-2-carboxylate isomerase [Pseudomonadota bacterium]MBT6464231.1 2-hydroxychromene-2-carboxylate isomerase [Pseudomonadota bacterium]MBT6673833.1 2-hydroxychromene-2-carboxylate isomerase [Pseudomonadota bacterium]
MKNTVEFFFDCSSPWTYLAFEGIQVNLVDIDIVWRPILVGGIFNSINPSVYVSRENPISQKVSYHAKDLQDWASRRAVIIGNPKPFPVNSVKAMRGAFFAIEEGLLVEYARAIFRRYWSDLEDISSDSVLKSVTQEVGLDTTEFFRKINLDLYKEKLRKNTDELISRQGYGSPTMFLNGSEMFFGNDRIDMLMWRISENKDRREDAL